MFDRVIEPPDLDGDGVPGLPRRGYVDEVTDGLFVSYDPAGRILSTTETRDAAEAVLIVWHARHRDD